MKLIIQSAVFCAAVAASSFSYSAQQIDQSQTSFNTGVPFTFPGSSTTNIPLGQSFTAGLNGLLSVIIIESNGAIQGGSNTLAYNIIDGNGVNGSILGSSSATVTSVLSPDNSSYLLSIDTSLLNINIITGHQYTFDFTNVSGPGDLSSRGILGNTANPYSGGRIFTGPGYGNQPNWDLAFKTEVGTSSVTPVPEPETYAMMLGGLVAFGFVARRRKSL